MVVLGVLDGGVRREEVSGEVVVRDGGVVGREVVTLEAERADLDLGSEVDDGEKAKDEATCAAAKRGVREESDV